MVKINKKLLPIKAHYFFFFAALGPILPQLNVFGKQLGVSPAAMGAVTAALPIFWMLAKPGFGYVADYFVHRRKMIFMGLILLMTGSYCGLWFFNDASLQQFDMDYRVAHLTSLQDFTSNLQSNSVSGSYTFSNNTCHWIHSNQPHNCHNATDTSKHFSAFMYSYGTSIRNPIFFFYNSTQTTEPNCNDYDMTEYTGRNIPETYMGVFKYSLNTSKTCDMHLCVTDLVCGAKIDDKVLKIDGSSRWSWEDFALYGTLTFWGFVLLNCIGTVSFNVANCIGDAICFDVLGPDNSKKYGVQRAWGTLGYGATALLSGWLVDLWSTHPTIKDFSPAFFLAALFTFIDLFSCSKLKLPKLSSDDSLAAMLVVLKTPRMMVFIIFAIVVGMLDSFIIYYNFWFLEEVAHAQNAIGSIKFLEGLTVAAQSFGGELLFFFLSGRIITKLGYANTLTLCLSCYALRLFLLSFITKPWHVLPIEVIMQGPTYGLCYSCIVGYAAEVAPVGLSATMQGLVAGMDDGFGFTVGSLLGGILYSWVGGAQAHRVMAAVALVAALTHFLLHQFTSLSQKTSEQEDEKKTNLEENLENIGMLDAVYKPTTISR